MVVVAGLVGALYAGGAILLDAPSRFTDPETFGDPWTLQSLTNAFESRGITVELQPPTFHEEYYPFPPERAPGLPGLGGPALLAAGSINGYSGGLLLYANPAERLRSWHDTEDGIAWTAHYARIPESHAFGLANSVVFVNTIPESGRDFDAILQAVKELRGD
jgi:hypothetical protein